MDNNFGFWDFFILMFIFIPMSILWFRAIVDIYDRRDIGGMAKTLWLLGVVIFPLIGVFVYLLARPETAQDRERAMAADYAMVEARDEQRRAAGFSVADELAKLDALRANGSLTQAEFETQRERILR